MTRHELRYLQGACPGCLRPLRIREAYLGLLISCNHCGNSFVAAATAGDAPEPAPDAAIGASSASANTPSARERALEDEVRDIRARLEDRERAVAEVESQLDQARDRGDRLECRVGELAEQLDDSRERQTRDAAEEASLREAQGRLTSELQSLRQTADSRQQALDRAADLTRELTAVRDELARDLAAARDDLGRSEATRVELDRELQEARTGLQAAEHARESTVVTERAAREALERRLDETSAAWEAERRTLVEAASRERRSQAEEAGRLAAALVGEREARGRLESEVSRLQDECEEARLTVSNRDWERRTTRRERDAFREQAEAAGGDRERLARELAGARSRIAGLECERDAAEARSRSDRLEVQRLRDEVSALGRALDAARRGEEWASHREAELQEEVERLQGELDELGRDLQRGREAFDRLLADREVERAAAAALDVEVRRCHRMIEYLYQRLEALNARPAPPAGAGARCVEVGTSAPSEPYPRRPDDASVSDEVGDTCPPAGAWVAERDPLAAELHARIARSAMNAGASGAPRGPRRGGWFRGRRSAGDATP